MKQYFVKLYHRFFGIGRVTHQEDDMNDQYNDNVISIFGRQKALVEDQLSLASKNQLEISKGGTQSPEDLFRETMQKNADIQKRLRESRNKANKSVLKSYRIKK